ncbi:mannose-1-phosphate guanyltransferase alpha-A-like [Watersipora subatra]|uniref:mannose-1-phosphate guanyltransferase alpha-A-like n=1 Tax=Watersipora subatra TaxID=2589382 RepID=UPI00355C09E8
MVLKAVILIGGPNTGTGFRPLTLDVPKPLFPIAGHPMIYHLIESCSQVEGLDEVLLIGSYQSDEQELKNFVSSVRKEFHLNVRYYQEFAQLGTAGGIYHFRDQILSNEPEAFFVLNSDICGEFPLTEMLQFHREKRQGADYHHKEVYTMLATEATRQQSHNYGCIVNRKETGEVMHYVEKPETFVSTSINCGVYLFSQHIFQHLSSAFKDKQSRPNFESKLPPTYRDESISLEKDLLMELAGTDKLFVYHTDSFWSQIKSAAGTIYANRNYLKIYRHKRPERLRSNTDHGPQIIGDVWIHSSAEVHPTATIGPNVSISKGAVIGAGARIKESLILESAHVHDHACILHSIIGRDSTVGAYTRVEGTPNDPNPDKPFSKMEVKGLFNSNGQLNPSITIIGSRVQVPSEIVVLNTIVLPHKDISGSEMNKIIL